MPNLKAVLMLSIFTAMTVSACSGGGANVQSSNTTYGQQLIDLKAAYDNGIITESQYKEGKENILDKMDD
jgi:hypothetical protein